MMDIYLALAVMLLFCVAAFASGLAIARRVPKRVAVALVVVDVVALLLFLKFLWDAPILTRLIPFRSVIVLGNFQPPISALLAGLAWGVIEGTSRRRLIFIAPLVIVSLWRGYGRVFDATPATRQRWDGDVCRQTSDATCSAAAAAML